MSDAEDTEAVSTTPEVTTEIEPPNDLAPPDAVSITEVPYEALNPSPDVNQYPPNASSKGDAVRILDSKEDGKGPRADEGQTKQKSKTEGKKLQTGPPPRSRCRARSRDTRKCKKHFRDMIGKHENRNEELEQHETDLRQRMEMLECSMPAVMVWNIWRMAQGAPVHHLREIVEKQFLEPGGGFSPCPSTPSQHWDCRVREVEAERKQAAQRAEEARKVFAVKGDALKSQKQQIEAARKLQEERKMQIARLEEEVKRLQDALKKAQGDENSCETGECGEIKCRQMWLQDVSSVSSIHSTDLECLARLQDLAEAELCMKRQIADLERRECAYMRTLQQADEMWAKMEDENASNLGDLKDQLDSKVAANQQLADRIVELEDEIEKLRMQLTKAVAILDEYTGKTFADVGLGDVNVSTEEKIEQTEDEAGIIEGLEVVPSEETKSMSIQPEESEQLQKKQAVEYKPMAESDRTQPELLGEEDKSAILVGKLVSVPDLIVFDEEIQATTETPTIEESVQVKPRLQKAETQSMPGIPGEEKGTATEERIQIQATVIEKISSHTGVAAVPKIDTEISVESVEQQQEVITASEETMKPVAGRVDEPVVAVNRRLFEDKSSLAHLLRTPTEDKDTEASVIPTPSANSTKQKEKIESAPGLAKEETPQETTRLVHEAATDGKITLKSVRRTADDIPVGADPEPTFTPVIKVSVEAAPVPVVKTMEAAPEVTEQHVVRPSEPVNEATSGVFPEPTIDDTPQPVAEPESKPVIDASPVSPAEPAIRGDDEPGRQQSPEGVKKPELKPVIDAAPVSPAELAIREDDKAGLQQSLEGVKTVESKPAANTFEVSIEALLSWHNTTACFHKQITNCAQCSSTSGEIQQMLNEIRTCLGKDAPELAKIECAKNEKEIENSIVLPNKRGPCICKPKTCPLGETPALPSPSPKPAFTPPQTQTSVQIQTVVDGQSQTSMPVRNPSKETERRSSKASRSSTKSKEEVKLESIEEGTEPDPRMRRVKSIPEARDESTVTVGDIGSQTETVRKAPSISTNVDDSCVCPTGVCPKQKAKAPPCGECAPGQLCTSTKKAQGKEYRSTADAILAPAIKVLPGNERGFSPPVRDGKSEVMVSESSMSACCICGNPVTPVASKKSTSIPVSKKPFSKNKLMLTSEASDSSFLCCACRSKGSPNSTSKNTSPSKSSERSLKTGRGANRTKPASDAVKSSCSREICCTCSDSQEIHVLTKPLMPELEIPKAKVKPETKDVSCVAKISRDKGGKTESRRRKDKESIKSTSSSVSHGGCGQMSSSSSAHKGPGSNVSSDSNFCCSSMGQVVDMTKVKKREKSKCACDSKDGREKKEKCVCGEDTKLIDPEQAKHSESTDSCVCPPKLFEKS